MSSHTKLSASSAERWMNCPGSVALCEHAPPEDPDDEPDYSVEGTAAHELAARVLNTAVHLPGSRPQAWELVGEKAENGVEFTLEMAEHVQVYIDDVLADEAGILSIESAVHDPEFHQHFGGIADAHRTTKNLLKVKDLKYGIGIIVEVPFNRQLMYYAVGVVRLMRKRWANWIPKEVEITVIQPRAPHPDGPIRKWTIGGEELMAWAELELLPAMLRTEEKDAPLVAGEHCRFCPAKVICPALREQFEHFAEQRIEMIPHLTDDTLAEMIEQSEPVKIYIKAIGDEAFKRMMRGAKIAGTKLVAQKSNRVFKEGAEDAAKNVFGDMAYSPRVLLSPAQMEKLFGGKDFTAQWAFKPDTGLTWATEKDKRPAQNPPDPNLTFANVQTSLPTEP